ncbi:MAG TPA: hypothetical protein VM364_12615 [Vicinamibacterales bacterium]|nr:hypothetical protein [Vicinamibacterales bacterium]
MSDAAATLRRLRLVLLGILVLGMSGTLAELVLLAHDEDAVQLIPIVLLALALPVAAWTFVRPGVASIRSLQLLMVLFVIAGAAGVFYHYDASVEFQRELEPELAGRALLWKVLQAKSPPALSPGVMVQLGLLGLACVFRHPVLMKRTEGEAR